MLLFPESGPEKNFRERVHVFSETTICSVTVNPMDFRVRGFTKPNQSGAPREDKTDGPRGTE
jgi:hypothetical protein